MNPWGIVVILLGAVIMWIGIRGTQGTLYSDIFGHPYVPAGNGVASASTLLTLPGTNLYNGPGASGLGVIGNGQTVPGNPPYSAPNVGGSSGTNVGGGTSIPGGTAGAPSVGGSSGTNVGGGVAVPNWLPA